MYFKEFGLAHVFKLLAWQWSHVPIDNQNPLVILINLICFQSWPPHPPVWFIGCSSLSEVTFSTMVPIKDALPLGTSAQSSFTVLPSRVP